MIAPVEAPFTLPQKPVKIVLFNAIKFAQVTLGLVPEILDAIDVILASGEQFGVVDAAVIKLRYIQRIKRLSTRALWNLYD